MAHWQLIWMNIQVSHRNTVTLVWMKIVILTDSKLPPLSLDMVLHFLNPPEFTQSLCKNEKILN